MAGLAVKRRKPTLDNETGARLGRPPKDIDEVMVRRAVTGMVKQGMSLDSIAKELRCSKTWLKKTFAAEVRYGKMVANALVTENLYQQAMKDSPSAIPANIFIHKAIMGYSDKKPDASVNTGPQVVFDFSGLSYEERAKLMHSIRVENGLIPPEEDDIDGEYVVEGEEEETFPDE